MNVNLEMNINSNVNLNLDTNMNLDINFYLNLYLNLNLARLLIVPPAQDRGAELLLSRFAATAAYSCARFCGYGKSDRRDSIESAPFRSDHRIIRIRDSCFPRPRILTFRRAPVDAI